MAFSVNNAPLAIGANVTPLNTPLENQIGMVKLQQVKQLAIDQEKQRQTAAAFQQALRSTSGDYDAAASMLDKQGYDTLGLRNSLADYRDKLQKGATAHLAALKTENEMMSSAMAGVDSQEKWDAIKPLVSRLDPEFAKQAGDVFVPEKFAMFKNIGVTAEQQHKMAEDALQSFAKGDKAHGLALAVAGTTDDKDLQGALQYAQANGTPAFMLQKYQGVKWSPELVAAAKADVIGPEKSAELEQKGVVQDRMTAADAERERHNRAMEAHGQAIEARMAAGGASKAGAGPEITIKPNTRESRIATDVATGRLPYADWQRMYGRGAQFAEKKAAMYDYARQINPDFDVASYEAGLKVASNPKIVMQVSSLNNVMSGVPDLLAASNAADSAGLRILNSYIKKGGFTIGGKAYSNLNTARTAFADELSGALGYGSATDMSRDMGFSMTDSTLPPDKFAAAIQDIVVPFVERKKRSILGGMGVYGQPGRSPASTEQHGQFDVQDPNGKWHPFTDQAASNRFKAAIAKAHP